MAGPTTGPAPQVMLVGRPGCHLCDQARDVLDQLCREFGLGFTEASIEDDPRLADLYFELIPVVLLDGAPVAHWWVDPVELRAALAAHTAGSR